MPYTIASPSLQKALRGRSCPYDITVEEVADNYVMLYVVVSVAPAKIDNAAWPVALGVDMLASFLDDYENMSFAFFDNQFYAIREQLRARSSKQRRSPLP